MRSKINGKFVGIRVKNTLLYNFESNFLVILRPQADPTIEVLSRCPRSSVWTLGPKGRLPKQEFVLK